LSKEAVFSADGVAGSVGFVIGEWSMEREF
jgi:hypothetical protein